MLVGSQEVASKSIMPCAQLPLKSYSAVPASIQQLNSAQFAVLGSMPQRNSAQSTVLGTGQQ